MTDRELTGDEAQRALSEAMRRTMATVPDLSPAELIAFVREVKDWLIPQITPQDDAMFSALLSVLEGRQTREQERSAGHGEGRTLEIAADFAERQACGVQRQRGDCDHSRCEMAMDIARGLRKMALTTAPSSVATGAGPDWKCAARVLTDPPQDCDWPTCGCDPYAEKVIEALQESGWTMTRDFATPVPLPDAAPSAYPIRAHVEGCCNALSVPVDLCACGGRDFTPDPPGASSASPAKEPTNG